MTFTIGWWAIPTAITLAVVAFGFMPSRRYSSSYGFGADIAGAFQLMVAIIAALVAWLVWALVA